PESTDAETIAHRIDRPVAEVTAAITHLTELALLIPDDGRTIVPGAVAEVLRGWPGEGLPSLEQLIHGSPPAALEPVGRADRASADRVASERALTAVTAAGGLGGASRAEP